MGKKESRRDDDDDDDDDDADATATIDAKSREHCRCSPRSRDLIELTGLALPIWCRQVAEGLARTLRVVY